LDAQSQPWVLLSGGLRLRLRLSCLLPEMGGRYVARETRIVTAEQCQKEEEEE
jgi:hypothetical protein